MAKRNTKNKPVTYRPPFRADGAYVLDAGGYVVDQFASGEQILCGCTKVVNAAEFVANALNAQASGVTIERRAAR